MIQYRQKERLSQNWIQVTIVSTTIKGLDQGKLTIDAVQATGSHSGSAFFL